VELAADANVLLSALIGGRARRVLDHPAVERVLTTEATMAEVHEYAPRLAQRKRLPLEIVLLAAATLPVEIVPRSAYVGSVARAQKLIGHRDPDDVEILALALRFRLPVWSNDNDFEEAGVTWYTTASLLAILDSKRR
jgi:predicted nucleic acid-binding protein